MEPFIGQIIMFAGNFAPRGWEFCNGQLLLMESNKALFMLIGTTYGGDGRDTFALPDLRGRVPIHPGQGPNLSNYNQGKGSGMEQVSLAVNNMPSHSHTATGTVNATFSAPSGGGSTSNPTNSNLSGSTGANVFSPSATNVQLAANSVAVTVEKSGGGMPFDIIQPWCGVQFIIAIGGDYPSRS